MTQPTRWLDQEGSSDEVRELLGSAGRSRALPDKVRTRSVARLDRYLVWPAAAGVLLWLKGVAIAAGIGVVSVVAVTQLRPMLQAAPPVVVEPATPIHAPVIALAATAPRATTAAAPAPVVSALAAPLAAPTAAPLEQDRALSARPTLPVPAASPAAAPTASTPAQPEVDPLTREAAMLERARASLDRDPRASLAELDSCAATFPSGSLRIERELLAVDALTRAGSRDEARRRAEALLPAARGTIYEPRVRSMLDRLQAP